MPTTLQTLADLGGLVRAARVARNLTQAELAARLGVGLRMLSELELGTRDLRTSNLLHVLGRLGFDLQMVPRTAPPTAPPTAPMTGATGPEGPEGTPEPTRRRVRHAAPRKTRKTPQRGHRGA